MKFKNVVFMNEKFMETIRKCNEYEKWPPKDAYWFNRFIKKMAAAQVEWNDIRNELVKKHGKEGDKGITTIEKENVELFQTDLNKVASEEFEIEGIDKIKFPDGLTLSPIEIGMLEDVFDMSSFEKSAENLL